MRKQALFAASALILVYLSSSIIFCIHAYAQQRRDRSLEGQPFSSRIAFLKTAGSVVVVDFEHISPLGENRSFGTAAGLRVAGNVRFIGYAASGVPGELYVAHSEGRNWGTGAMLVGDRFNYNGKAGSRGSRIDILLPVGIKAVGMNFMTVQTDLSKPPRPCKFKVNTENSSQVYTANSTGDGTAFIGFISEVPIRSIAFWVEGGTGENAPYGALDNVTFTSVALPPEGADATRPQNRKDR